MLIQDDIHLISNLITSIYYERRVLNELDNWSTIHAENWNFFSSHWESEFNWNLISHRVSYFHFLLYWIEIKSLFPFGLKINWRKLNLLHWRDALTIFLLKWLKMKIIKVQTQFILKNYHGLTLDFREWRKFQPRNSPIKQLARSAFSS